MWYGDFIDAVERLKKARDITGAHLFDEWDIVDIFGFKNPGELREKISEARKLRRKELVEKVKVLKGIGETTSSIAKMLGLNESSIRALEFEADHGLPDLNDGISAGEIERALDMLKGDCTLIDVRVPVYSAESL